MYDDRRDYLPAAGTDWALPLYDPVTRLLGADAARRKLLDQASLSPGHRVLDIGCGTGTLATLVKQLQPSVDMIGLDPDPKALARARKKTTRARVSVHFDQGFSDHLPYPDESFDRVFSSLMFHHIANDDRPNTLREIRRVLKPGGSFHLVDFSKPEGGPHGLFHLIHANGHISMNSDAGILALMSQAGFSQPRKANEARMMFGLLRVAYFAASV